MIHVSTSEGFLSLSFIIPALFDIVMWWNKSNLQLIIIKIYTKHTVPPQGVPKVI